MLLQQTENACYFGTDWFLWCHSITKCLLSFFYNVIKPRSVNSQAIIAMNNSIHFLTLKLELSRRWEIEHWPSEIEHLQQLLCQAMTPDNLLLGHLQTLSVGSSLRWWRWIFGPGVWSCPVFGYLLPRSHLMPGYRCRSCCHVMSHPLERMFATHHCE